MSGSKRGLIALLLVGFMSTPPAYADELIGKWRDKFSTFYDATIEIRKSDDGSYYQLRYDNIGNAPPTRYELVTEEDINYNFLVVDTPFDNELRIRSDGNLNIVDHGLLVRVAIKIE